MKTGFNLEVTVETKKYTFLYFSIDQVTAAIKSCGTTQSERLILRANMMKSQNSRVIILTYVAFSSCDMDKRQFALVHAPH